MGTVRVPDTKALYVYSEILEHKFDFYRMLPSVYTKVYHQRYKLFSIIIKQDQSTEDKLKEIAYKMKDYSDDKVSLKKFLNTTDNFGMTPLHTAASHNLVGVCRFLVRVGASLNTTNRYGYTALFITLAVNADVQLVEFLLKEGADVFQQGMLDNDTHWSMFHLCALRGKVEYLKLLFKYGANPKIVFLDHVVPSQIAPNLETKMLIYSMTRKIARRILKESSPCSWCGLQTMKLKHCASCYITLYCSKRCQKAHWEEEHSKTCPGSLFIGQEDIFEFQPSHPKFVEDNRNLTALRGKSFVAAFQVTLINSFANTFYKERRPLLSISNEDAGIMITLKDDSISLEWSENLF